MALISQPLGINPRLSTYILFFQPKFLSSHKVLPYEHSHFFLLIQGYSTGERHSTGATTVAVAGVSERLGLPESRLHAAGALEEPH